MAEGGIPNNPSSSHMRRLTTLDVAYRKLQLLPGRLSRLQSLPSPRSSIQSSPEFESIALSLLEIPSSTRSSSSIPPLSTNLSLRMDGSTQENWNEVRSNVASRSHISPETTVFYSCDGGEISSEVFRRGSSNHKVLEWIFALANFIIELSSIVFDQLSSQHNSLFLPMCMGMSFLSLIICVFELVYKVRQERVIWIWRDTIPRFYYPSETGVPFGSCTQLFGLICAFGQCIVATTSYCLFIKNGKNPIRISIWAAIFAFCQLCSKLFREFRQEDVHRQDVSSVELTSSGQ
ncbi:conserved hypothetical protein [Ricinus communis]|uniref:Uncharacterized protein n=1 Tax=Ricinus communis TaxID=3988 RepID=B9SXY1_RICCO|nr:conserved hypothetical protein [Ricinus communis]